MYIAVFYRSGDATLAGSAFMLSNDAIRSVFLIYLTYNTTLTSKPVTTYEIYTF